MKKNILCILIVLFLAGPAGAFSWVIENDLDVKIEYRIYWEDHNKPELFGYGPGEIIVGDLDPAASHKFGRNWPAGKYFIVFSDKDDTWGHSIRMDLSEVDSEDYIVTVQMRALPVKITVIGVTE